VDNKPKKIKEVYTVRDVIKQIHGKLVDAEIPYRRHEKEYIGSYQRAVTTVHQNMTKKQLEKAKEIAELWNEEGAPPEVQQK
jgi:hypothetical protein